MSCIRKFINSFKKNIEEMFSLCKKSNSTFNNFTKDILAVLVPRLKEHIQDNDIKNFYYSLGKIMFIFSIYFVCDSEYNVESSNLNSNNMEETCSFVDKWHSKYLEQFN